jgi:hypothetical protein
VQVTASGAALPFCAALQRALQAPQMCQESTPRRASARMRLADKTSREGFSAQRLALGRGLVGEASFPHRERFPWPGAAPAPPPPPPQHRWVESCEESPPQSRYTCRGTGDPRADARAASARSDRDLAQAYLVVPLQHAYTEHGRRPDRLKGRDRLMWQLLEPCFELALCSLSFSVLNPDTRMRAMNRRTGRRFTLNMDDDPGIEALSRRGLSVSVDLDAGAYVRMDEESHMRVDFASRWSPLSDARIVAWLHCDGAKRLPLHQEDHLGLSRARAFLRAGHRRGLDGVSSARRCRQRRMLAGLGDGLWQLWVPRDLLPVRYRRHRGHAAI